VVEKKSKNIVLRCTTWLWISTCRTLNMVKRFTFYRQNISPFSPLLWPWKHSFFVTSNQHRKGSLTVLLPLLSHFRDVSKKRFSKNLISGYRNKKFRPLNSGFKFWATVTTSVSKSFFGEKHILVKTTESTSGQHWDHWFFQLEPLKTTEIIFTKTETHFLVVGHYWFRNSGFGRPNL